MYGPGMGYGPNGMAPGGPSVMATDNLPQGAMPMDSGVGPMPVEPVQPLEGESGPLVEPDAPGAALPPDPAASYGRPQWQRTALAPVNHSILHNRPAGAMPATGPTSTPGLIGPIGYDVQK
jgi:hypothetical protein